MADCGNSVALGTFDGLHMGHLSVIKSAVACGAGSASVLLFKEHPALTLTGKAPGRITSREDEESILLSLGAKPVYIDFGEIRNLSPEEFFETTAERMNAICFSCGFNYRFGRDASGTTALLSELCASKGIKLNISPAVMYDGSPVSSTRIRQCIQQGDIPSVNAMLGRRFSYKLTVNDGDKRGRTLGFPTINQRFGEELIVPAFGVYASETEVEGAMYPSVTNIGIRPTIGTENIGSETHIIGFSGDLYGQSIRVSLVEKLRDECRYASLDELSLAISRDRENAGRIYERNKKE